MKKLNNYKYQTLYHAYSQAATYVYEFNRVQQWVSAAAIHAVPGSIIPYVGDHNQKVAALRSMLKIGAEMDRRHKLVGWM